MEHFVRLGDSCKEIAAIICFLPCKFILNEDMDTKEF